MRRNRLRLHDFSEQLVETRRARIIHDQGSAGARRVRLHNLLEQLVEAFREMLACEPVNEFANAKRLQTDLHKESLDRAILLDLCRVLRRVVERGRGLVIYLSRVEIREGTDFRKDIPCRNVR